METHQGATQLELKNTRIHAAVYAQVLVNIEAKVLNSRVFTYKIPDTLLGDVQVGTPVLIPFGRQPEVTGFVVNILDKCDSTFTIKEITDVLDDTPLFNARYYAFLQWVATYTATPITQVLTCALPANLIQKTKKLYRLSPKATLNSARSLPEKKILEFLKANPKPYTGKFIGQKLKLPKKILRDALQTLKKENLVLAENELTQSTQAKTQTWVCLSANADTQLTSRQKAITDYLKHYGDTPQSIVVEKLKTTHATLKKLAETGAISLEDRAVIRDPLQVYNTLQAKQFTLTPHQQQAADAVMNSLPGSEHLLFGITGSGKTEVYLDLCRQTLTQNKSALILVPEIALTSQIAQRFINHFGQENIALWHSNLSAGEKADTWRRLANGDLKILIAARSGIWAPLKNLGLIVIDEEHDGSYKQDSPAPRYDARTLSRELCQRTGSKLLIGSATPDIVTYHTAQKENRILNLPERYGGRELAKVTLVDMKKERANGQRGNISRALVEALKANIAAEEQAIVLMNRRGFYTSITCKLCDYVFVCPQCDVSLTVHKTQQTASCHYCGYASMLPKFCPQCAGNALSQTGVGIQRIEEELKQHLPDARIIRLDSDTSAKKDAHRQVLDTFRSHEADILLGTQMVAKGLDIPNVTLVGVIAADSTFNLPDFKSAERGFQLITQVAGRAGRGEKPGRVIIQAIEPEHPVICFAQQQDYTGFYQHELVTRESSGFPPFSQLVRFIVSSPDEKQGWQFMQATAEHLKLKITEACLEQSVTLLGPASCVIGKIQGRHRYHLLVKNASGPEGQALLSRFYTGITPPENIHFLIDVDTQTLL